MDDIVAAAKNKKSIGIPRVTNLKNETEAKTKKTFKAKMFMLTDDHESQAYAEFMNELIINNAQVLREDHTWTQHGELMKFIEYME